jgi:hypothetical protein
MRLRRKDWKVAVPVTAPGADGLTLEERTTRPTVLPAGALLRASTSMTWVDRNRAQQWGREEEGSGGRHHRLEAGIADEGGSRVRKVERALGCQRRSRNGVHIIGGHTTKLRDAPIKE